MDINTITITGAMPTLPSHARKPWETYALATNGVEFAQAGTTSALSGVVGTAAVGGSVLRDAGTVQGPPRVPR